MYFFGCSLRLIALFLGVFVSSVFAFDYNSSSYVKISNLPKDIKPLVTGFYKNKLSLDNSLSFDANLVLDDDTYIYSVQEKDAYTYFRGVLGATYEKDSFLVSFGFYDSISSKDFYNDLFVIESPYFGVSALFRDHQDKNIVHYTLKDGYMNNNTAMSLSFVKKLIGDSMYFGVTITPSMDYSLTADTTTDYKSSESMVDSALIYYSEHESLGYGFNLASRYYFDSEETQDLSRDVGIGGVIDYFGFSLKANYIVGNNDYNLKQGNTESYDALEASFLYNISVVSLGVYYFTSEVRSTLTKYNTEITELDVRYKFSETFALYSGLFHEVLNFSTNSDKLISGVLLGLSLSF